MFRRRFRASKGRIVKRMYGFKARLPVVKRVNHRPLYLALGCLSGLLLIAAVVVGASIYNEGEAARREAQKLLAQYERIAFPVLTAAAGGYIQPENADAEPADVIEAIQTLSGYQVIGKLTIQKIGVELPVISHTEQKALEVSVCWYQGSIPGETGNMVITGHNYANGAHFGKLDELKEGDSVILDAPNGKAYRYEVYETQVVKPDNAEALNEYEGQTALTLLTCSSHGNRRLLVRCKLVLR